eukprot:TRINITY_DN829_c0_g1_i1.p1 TRINITY_DN829_c0_g1~~TRINITY_DN829_c0_g1_i1.p1  ORF type:complete len:161 (+),score=23.15 TRINITY_DN829_c0_g1_i1:312-794(+)
MASAAVQASSSSCHGSILLKDSVIWRKQDIERHGMHILLESALVGEHLSVKEKLSALLRAFPDIRLTILSSATKGGKVAVKAKWSGTHKGDLFGLPATKKRVEFPTSIFLERGSSGAITRWGSVDMQSLLRQLGLPDVTIVRKPEENRSALAKAIEYSGM